MNHGEQCHYPNQSTDHRANEGAPRARGGDTRGGGAEQAVGDTRVQPCIARPVAHAVNTDHTLLLAGVGNVEALVARNAGAAQTAAGASPLSHPWFTTLVSSKLLTICCYRVSYGSCLSVWV
eukprot:scaffold6631_cov61-Phaeocystis_antarctica.AAC.6